MHLQHAARWTTVGRRHGKLRQLRRSCITQARKRHARLLASMCHASVSITPALGDNEGSTRNCSRKRPLYRAHGLCTWRQAPVTKESDGSPETRPTLCRQEGSSLHLAHTESHRSFKMSQESCSPTLSGPSTVLLQPSLATAQRFRASRPCCQHGPSCVPWPMW